MPLLTDSFSQETTKLMLFQRWIMDGICFLPHYWPGEVNLIVQNIDEMLFLINQKISDVI